MLSFSSTTSKGTTPKNALMQRTRTERGNVRQLEEPSNDKKDEKSSTKIRTRHSDLNRSDHDPFFRYWIKLYDLAGPVRDELHPAYLAHVIVDVGRGLVATIWESRHKSKTSSYWRIIQNR